MLIIISTSQFPHYSWYRLAAIISLGVSLLCVGRERDLGTHCLHMLSSPRISGNLGIWKICSVTLTSVRHADFSCVKDACHWPHSVWTMTKERYTLCLQELSMHLSVSDKSMKQSFPLKFTNCLNEAMQTVAVKAIIVSDFKTAWRCLTGSITLEWSLSAGKQNISINFSSKQVTKGTLHMHEHVYQVLFPPPPHKSQGTRLAANVLLYAQSNTSCGV